MLDKIRTIPSVSEIDPIYIEERRKSRDNITIVHRGAYYFLSSDQKMNLFIKIMIISLFGTRVLLP